MNPFVLAIAILVSYLMISIIVQRILFKFTGIHKSDVSAISILWIAILPIWGSIFILRYVYNNFVKIIDKYLERFGGK